MTEASLPHHSSEDLGDVDDFDLGMLAGEEAAEVHEAGFQVGQAMI